MFYKLGTDFTVPASKIHVVFKFSGSSQNACCLICCLSDHGICQIAANISSGWWVGAQFDELTQKMYRTSVPLM
jgi:hypothetical protein